MKSKYPISFGKDHFGKDHFGKDHAPIMTADVASTIAKLKEENEILRRLAELLSAQLHLARGLSVREGQRRPQ